MERKFLQKKGKLRDQDCLLTSRCNGNDLGEGDANAVYREVSGGFKKQKISKVIQIEKEESSTSKGEEKSRIGGDANAVYREVSGGFKKQKISKVIQIEKEESSTSKGEEKSRIGGIITRIMSRIKDSSSINKRNREISPEEEV
ncbi:hypothetical protein BC332_27853 [Capsicum chinense]|nr:hypothetical protein BC332_27853 [Capsicum chinense]